MSAQGTRWRVHQWPPSGPTRRWWIEGTMPDGTEYQLCCRTFADVQRAFGMDATQ